MPNHFKKEFFETLLILKNYLSDLVIAGGWSPLIYYHYLLSDKTREPLRTKDIDIVVPAHLEKRKDRTAYPDMNDEQSCQYVFGIFQEFIDNL